MAEDEHISTVSRPTLRLRMALVVIMYLEWIVMAFLIGLVFVRLVYSTDRNWLYFVLLLLLAVFLLVPVLITISCLQEATEPPQQLQQEKPVAKSRRRNASVKIIQGSSKPVTPPAKIKKRANRKEKEEDIEPNLDFIVKKEILTEQKEAPKARGSVESKPIKANRKADADTELNLDLTVKKEIPAEQKEAVQPKSSPKANKATQEAASTESKPKKNPRKSSQVKTTPSQDKNKPDDSDGGMCVTVKVERAEQREDSAPGGVQIHTEVGEEDELNLETKVGRSGLDVHTEAVAGEDGVENTIKLELKEEVPGAKVKVETQLEEEDSDVTTTATVQKAGAGKGSKKTEKSVEAELEETSGEDGVSAESDLHVKI